MTHEELKKTREEKNLSKGEFAALIGITAMMQGRHPWFDRWRGYS